MAKYLHQLNCGQDDYQRVKVRLTRWSNLKTRMTHLTRKQDIKTALRNFNISKAHLQMNSTRSKGILLLYDFYHLKFRKKW